MDRRVVSWQPFTIDLEQQLDDTALASEHFFKGLKALNAGDLAAAEASFLEARRLAPGRPSVLVNLSVVYAQTARLAEALSLAEEAVSLEGTEPLYWLQKGIVQLKLERFEAALVSFDTALAMKPDVAELHNGRGSALKELGRLHDALASFDKAVSLKPAHAQAHINRSATLKELGRLDDALASSDRAISLNRGRAEAHNNRGNVLKDLNRLEEALASYDQAISLKSDYAEAYNNRGNVLRELNRLEEALASYGQAISLKPDYAEAYSNRGIALAVLDRWEEALECHDHAVTLKPDHAEAHSNRGNVLKDLNRLEEALASYDRSISLKPGSAEAHVNRGIVLKELNRFDEARASYDRALTLQPGYAEAQHNKAHLLLFLAEFTEGFELYTSRWRTKGFGSVPLKTALPKWDGKPLNGGLLLWAEQGIGDEIFYASMLSLIPDDTTEIALYADRRLHPVYARSFPGVRLLDRDHQKNSVEADFAAHAPIGDLGAILKLDGGQVIRRRYPFLSVNPDRKAVINRIGCPETNPVCGISWKSANRKFGTQKSISLLDLKPLLTIPGLSFVNLQYGDVASEIDDVRASLGVEIHQVPGLDVFDDIEGLLALIDACDVVVTTCNVTAHLAGAIGKKGIVLAPTGKGRIWYWRGERYGEWYPSLALVTQEHHADWQKPIQQAADMLKHAQWYP